MFLLLCRGPADCIVLLSAPFCQVLLLYCNFQPFPVYWRVSLFPCAVQQKGLWLACADWVHVTGMGLMESLCCPHKPGACSLPYVVAAMLCSS